MCCSMPWCLATLIPHVLVSPMLTQVLHRREVTIVRCRVRSCPPHPIPRLLVSALLAQVLHNRDVTFECRPVQWCPAMVTSRLQTHPRSVHHSLHNLQISSFRGLQKATTIGQVLGLVTATLGISQVQFPAPRIDVLTRSVQRRASIDVNTRNSGYA